MTLRQKIVGAAKANVMWGALFSGTSAVVTYLLIQYLPPTDFAAMASALAAVSVTIVIVEGGLTWGFTRYLPAAQADSVGAALYRFVLMRRVGFGVIGALGIGLWALVGASKHALLDAYLGRAVWGCVAWIFLAELFAMLPQAGLQALFEFRRSLAIRALFAAVRGAAILAGWALTHDILVVLLVHGSVAFTEGLAYHLQLKKLLAQGGRLTPDMVQNVQRYGLFSIVEKGAHTVGGINGFFLLLGYLLPAEALAPLAIAKELSQRAFALVTLPINSLSTAILNASAQRDDLLVVASRTVALTSLFVFSAASLVASSLSLVLPALRLVSADSVIALSIVVFGGISTEYVLRYDQSYRFRRGELRQAVIWAYLSALAGIGLCCSLGVDFGLWGALGAYFSGRLCMLGVALLYRWRDRYDWLQLRWTLLLTVAFVGLVGSLVVDLHGFSRLVGILLILVCCVGYVRDNTTWLLRSGAPDPA